jgi:hypothetical protein
MKHRTDVTLYGALGAAFSKRHPCQIKTKIFKIYTDLGVFEQYETFKQRASLW